MFLSKVELVEVFTGVWETAEPLIFVSAVPDAPPAITVPAGFRTRFERIPPPLRGWVVPVGTATGPALVYAFLRETESRQMAMAVFQEALRAEGVGFLKRLVFRLSW